MARAYLLLQGPQGPFFSKLYHQLRAFGHKVYKINFNGGDLLFSLGCNCINFNGNSSEWETYIQSFLIKKNITDLLVYNDCRPIHKIAIRQAKTLKIKVHIFEEGYLRPNWITLEEDGVNGFSKIPKNPSWYMSNKTKHNNIASGAKTFGPTLSALALYCILYHLFQIIFFVKFYKYKTHRPYSLLQDIKGWFKRICMLNLTRAHAFRVQDMFITKKYKFYLFALQLNSDSQIWQHSSYNSNLDLINEVITSFCLYAPSDTFLLIKQHPLDSGVINYKKHIAKQADKAGISSRIYFISGGHLPTLIKSSSGVIVVNSTVGISALHHKTPTIALGTSIYNFEGLTFQGGLDDFWTKAESPNNNLYTSFRNYLLKHNQINGNFYVIDGINHALPFIIRKIASSKRVRVGKLNKAHNKHANLPLNV